MQDFPAGQSGHDHFFDTFGKFGEATRDRGKMLANVADTVVEQNQFYLETLVTPASDAAKKLADAVGYDADLAALHRKLTAGGKLDKVVAEAVREADAADAQFRETARCDSDRPAPGCRLPVRWISQVSRGSSNERVFTQMAVGMRLAERDRDSSPSTSSSRRTGRAPCVTTASRCGCSSTCAPSTRTPASPCTPVS